MPDKELEERLDEISNLLKERNIVHFFSVIHPEEPAHIFWAGNPPNKEAAQEIYDGFLIALQEASKK